jgi:RNA recognition motif-containing protein
MDPSNEEIRTVFITGLPDDVKEREINLLFRKCSGFEGGFVKLNHDKPMVFASFTDQYSALSAINDIQGVVFDFANPTLILQASLAKHNTKNKRALEVAAVVPETKRRVYMTPSPLQMISPQLSYPVTFPPIMNHSTGYTSMPPLNLTLPSQVADSEIKTIFINNIDETSGGEAVLTEHIKMFPGFVRMKMGKSGKSAFAEFASHDNAWYAISSLNGARIAAGQYDLRVEFAKTNTKS